MNGILVIPRMLSIEELDKLIENLDNAMDASAASDDNEDTNKRENTEGSTSTHVEQVGQALYLELPTEIWTKFQEYCKWNELDPAQQIREAVASYYRDLLQIYKMRMNAFDPSNLM